MSEISDLLTHWAERDARYALRKPHGRFMALTENEISSILAYRRRETDDLGDTNKHLALVELARWVAPAPMY